MPNYSHQDRLFDPLNKRPVTLIGAGSVGSFVAFTLAKMGVDDITVWDGDSVASHNIPMSLYREGDLAKHKVDALAVLVRDLTGVNLTVHSTMYEGARLKNRSVISCVDTMMARQKIWKEVKRNPTIDLFVDTRTAAGYVEVITIDPNDSRDIARYEALWFEDKQAARQMCGQHGIAFASMRAAGIVSANLVRYWEERKKEWRVAERCDTLTRAI